jgi:type II secretory pathway component GspD/PulD (secretin)
MLISPTSRSFGVLCLSAASALVWAQDPAAPMPVTRLSGQAAAQDSAPQPRRPTDLRGIAVTRLDEGSRLSELESAQRLTVSFAHAVAIRDALLLLVRGTPFSVAIDPAAKGTFAGELKNVTLRQAIDSVLTPNGLSYDLDGAVIRVFPRRTETRVFDLNVLNVERSWQRTIAVGEASALTSRVPSADALDELTSGIATLLSDAGRVHVDRRASMAQVTDYTDRLDRVGAYLDALHARGSRQVRLQARLLEVTLSSAVAIDWRAVRARLGVSEQAAAAGCAIDPVALQVALAAQGDVRVVSAPALVAVNNEPALVRAVTPGSSALVLTVVPQISEDGIVQLSLSPSWARKTASSPSQDAMGVTESDTVLRIADGSTAMVTGLLHSEERSDRTVTREVVVLLTPTIVNTGSAVAAR